MRVVVLGKENKDSNIEINQEKIEQVNTIKHLGLFIDREGFNILQVTWRKLK